MCILLYVKLVQCSCFAQIYPQLEKGPSALGICAFCYMLNLFGVVVLQDLWSIGGGRPWYICILLYVKLIQCNDIT